MPIPLKLPSMRCADMRRNETVKRGQKAVEKWLQLVRWLQGRKGILLYHQAVPSRKDTELSNGRAAKIYGSFNGYSFETRWGEPGDNPQIDHKVGPVSFKWGDQGVFEVTVERQYGQTWLYYVNPDNY